MVFLHQNKGNFLDIDDHQNKTLYQKNIFLDNLLQCLSRNQNLCASRKNQIYSSDERAVLS